MANYSVEKWRSSAGGLDTVLTALHDKLETIDDSKTLHVVEVLQVQGDICIAVLVYDA